MASEEAKIRLGLTISLIIFSTSTTAKPFNGSFLLLGRTTLTKLLQASVDDPNHFREIPVFMPNEAGEEERARSHTIRLLYNDDLKHAYWTAYSYTSVIVFDMEGNRLNLMNRPSDPVDVHGLAYDPTSRLLFYTSKIDSSGSVGVFDMKGRELTLYLSPVIVDVIVVHPPKGLLFFMARKIGLYRMEMNGANLIEIATSEEQYHPRALAIDYEDSLLYWIDTSNAIISCDFDGGNGALLIHEHAGLREMMVIEGYLYYSTYQQAFIKKMNLDNTSDVALIGPGWSGVTGFDIYIPGVTDKVVPKHPECSVNNQNCSHFCLPVSGGYVCACETGYNILPDKKHCENLPRCPSLMKSAVVNDTEQCVRVAGQVCEFECLKGYKPKAPSITSIRCTNETDANDASILLWNSEPCTEIFCPNSIDNGVLIEPCDVRHSSTCDYRCDILYQPHRDLPSVTCVGDGRWGKEGLDLIVCSKCIHAVEPLKPTFGQCQPYVLEGIVRGDCQNCDGYHDIKYDWKLWDSICSERTTFFEGIDSTVELFCNSLNCDNLRNGMTSERLTLIITVTARHDPNSGTPVKSSQHTEVFVRKLPVEEEELQCAISPEVGGKAFETKYHINCTALHVKFDLYQGNDNDFYKNHGIQFKKKIYVESESEVLLIVEFVEPVSEGFSLPPGDPVILKVNVFNCENIVLSQIIQLEVLDYNLSAVPIDEWKDLVANDSRVIQSTAVAIRNAEKTTPNASDYLDLRKEMLSVLTELNETSVEEVTTTTQVLNIMTENVEWLHNISAKTDVVNLYSKLSGNVQDHEDQVSQDEVMFMTGVVVKGVSTLLDHFVDEKGQENKSETDSEQMLNMSKQLMVSLHEAGDTALRNLPQTDSPVFLYASETTALVVQKQNASEISGTTLLVESIDPDVGDTSFELPNDVGFEKDSEIKVQMIYQKKNPFTWQKTSIQVTSPVLTVDIKDEDENEIKMDHLSDPVMYIVPRTVDVFYIGQISVTYTRKNGSFYPAGSSEMFMVSATIHPRETKLFKILLPENISEIWVYGQPFQPPDYQTVLRQGFNYPKDWKAMQVFFNYANDSSSLPNEISDYICIKANEHFFSVNQSSYEMYFGITINFNDSMKQLEGLDTKCKHIYGDCTDDLKLSFSIQLDSLYCVFWNETLLDWSTDGCEVFPVSSSKQLKCGCYHLSSFSASHGGGDFFVKPVLLTFDDVTLFLTFFDNPVVVTAVVVVWIIYFCLIYWARRLDDKDMEQIGVLNCDDNRPSEEYLYLVCVMTGWWNQAGTTANIYMSISGVSGSTSKKKLSTNARQCFQSGFEDWFVFTTERGLDVLESVTIWHDNSGKSPHWYLTQVYVKDLQTGASWNFIYNDWLAVDRGDLRHTSATIPATTDEDMKLKQKYNFIITSSRKLRESHLWISIYAKSPQSSFSRVQRLTCGLSLLLTMMLTNIMFYGLPEDDPNEQIQAGVFSFSLRQFIIGIESSIIMFPVNIIIVQLFIRVRPKPGNEQKSTTERTGKQQVGPSYKDRLASFYGMLSRSKKFEKNKFHGEICSMFPDKERDKYDSIIVEKYLESSAKNMLWESFKGSERTHSPYNLTEGFSEKEFYDKLKQTRTVSLLQLSSEQSSLTYLSKKSSPSLSSEDEAIEINVNMSNCCTKKKQSNINKTWTSVLSSSSSCLTTEQKPIVNRKGVKKVLPWWFIYISWSIVMLTCFVSSFFIMLYGLKYGYTRSMEWIVSFLTGFFQGICVEQPLKVLGLSLILALILQRPAEIEEYGPDMELAKNEEYVSEIKIEDYKHQPFVEPISHSLLKRIRQRLRLEWFMDMTIRDLVLYIFYLTVLLMMVHGHSNNYTSYQNSKTIYNLMVEPGYSATLLEVTTPEDFYTYMLETFVPVTERMSVSHSDVVTSTSDHYLLGFFRLRQLRVKPGKCAIALPHNLAVRCLDNYWIGSEDTDSYAGNWSSKAINNLGPGPWTYQDSWDLRTLPFAGTHATYSGGGYVQILKNNATGEIQELDDKGWIDERTRAVFVECTLYNPNVDLFTSVIFLFEMTPFGYMYTKNDILSTNLHHYDSDFQKVVAVCEILFVCFSVFYIYIEYQKLKRIGRRKYFSETWTFVELFLIVLSLVTIGLFTKRFITLSNTLKDYVENHKIKYINFSEAFLWNSILEYVMAFLVAIAIMKATKLLTFMGKIKLFTKILAKIRHEFLGYLFLFLILMTAYSQCATLFFGRAMHIYKNIQRSFYHNTLIIIGSEIAQEIKSISPVFGPIYMITFVIAVNFILVQLCVTILNTGIILTKFELSRKSKKKFLNYITTKVRMIIARK